VECCAFCNNAAIARCKSCGKQLCVGHDIFDDPYHTGGLFHHPAHWCKQCHDNRQGKWVSILVLIAIILLGVIITTLILT
jgi:hypothetical protein